MHTYVQIYTCTHARIHRGRQVKGHTQNYSARSSGELESKGERKLTSFYLLYLYIFILLLFPLSFRRGRRQGRDDVFRCDALGNQIFDLSRCFLQLSRA